MFTARLKDSAVARSKQMNGTANRRSLYLAGTIFAGLSGAAEAGSQADSGAPQWPGLTAVSPRRILTCSPLPDGILVSGFGLRKNPKRSYSRFHTGIDLRGYSGQPVRSADRGVITAVRANRAHDYLVEVRHGPDLKTVYSHLAGLAAHIRSGVVVSSGEMLGKLARSHRPELPLLHFEVVFNGRFVDPSMFRTAPAAC
jgi:murein DD-endopeptidase MepM/ murein hydrolase activator NlpD